MRLDNRSELAGALGLADASTVPDSAFVLAGYERWGHGVLERLIGEFALAIVDRGRGGVLLARDHVGMRPLAVHERSGVVGFASTALALTGFDGVGRRLDERRAAEVLALVYETDRTVVEGVRSLPPATALWVDGGGARRQTWWRPDLRGIVELDSPAEYEHELREALEAAVGAGLRSVGPVAAQTSGGLDSSSVAATAARLLGPRPLRTYTSAPPPGWRAAGLPGADADEWPLVLELAEMHPNMVPAVLRTPTGVSLLDVQEPLWELGAGPARNPDNVLWLRAIAERAGADGATTLLSGARGNAFFSADGPDWLARLVRAGRLATAGREAAAWARADGKSLSRTLAADLVQRLAPPAARRRVRASIGRREAVQDWVESSAQRPEHIADVDPASQIPALRDGAVDLREIAIWLIQSGASRADDRAALAALTGVEERDPTADRRVLRAAMRQPEWVRRHDGTGRAVVRGAMADRLPAEIVRRTRRGEQLPDWLDVMTANRDEFAAEVAAMREHPLLGELVDTDRLTRLVDAWPDPGSRANAAVVRNYRLALLRAAAFSRYLRWFERHVPATPTAGPSHGAEVQ
jgi:asparagine synthase (glutamine-hydrolysing)